MAHLAGLDVISILPFDVLSIVASKAFANLKIFRLFRLMRLIKLVRLIRASRMFKRWEVRMSINYGTLALTKSADQVKVGVLAAAKPSTYGSRCSRACARRLSDLELS